MRALLRFLYTLEVPRLSGAPLQAGALCWRRGDHGIEVLLVTSRNRGKWGVPKGWARRWRPLHLTASREAWEEGGVVGSVDNRLLGMVERSKAYRLVGVVDWKIALYPLKVDRLARTWPEQRQRKRRWFSLEQAAGQVRPKALASLIANFQPET